MSNAEFQRIDGVTRPMAVGETIKRSLVEFSRLDIVGGARDDPDRGVDSNKCIVAQ